MNFINKYTMSSLIRIFQLINNVTRFSKNVLHERTNLLTFLQLQTCTYTKKSVEETLGIEKPKRPLNPFFKYMIQMKPALNAKIPGISSKEAIVWSSKHWQQLDHEMKKEYEHDLENYRKKKEKYEASLTEAQKGDIKKVKEKIILTQKKRKLKSVLKEMGKPKKPMSSYILFAQSRNIPFQSQQMKKYQEKIRMEWLNLSDSERVKYTEQARDLMKKYKNDIKIWELKMISMGLLHLVQRKPDKQKKIENISSK